MISLSTCTTRTCTVPATARRPGYFTVCKVHALRILHHATNLYQGTQFLYATMGVGGPLFSPIAWLGLNTAASGTFSRLLLRSICSGRNISSPSWASIFTVMWLSNEPAISIRESVVVNDFSRYRRTGRAPDTASVMHSEQRVWHRRLGRMLHLGCAHKRKACTRSGCRALRGAWQAV